MQEEVEEEMVHYPGFSCTPRFPPCHKYKRPASSVVADSDLATYQSLVCVGPHVALSDLLAVNEILCPIERVRVSLLETMIGQCLHHLFIYRIFYRFELATDPTQIIDDDWSAAFSIANLAFVPQIFDEESRFIYRPQLKRTEFTWVREDTVLCIATYLDDERCLQASVSRLINAILEEKDHPGDYFGVAFSVQHCTIVKVVKDEHATMFSHTDALQFFPSFYKDSPSTPGIVALARLTYRVDPVLFVRALAVGRWHSEKSLPQEADDVPLKISCPVLPPELWQDIALHLHVRDLLTFGLVSRLCREAASTVLRYPHVCAFRLVAAKEKPQPGSPYHELVPDMDIFSAVRAGIPADVFIARWADKTIVIPLGAPHSNTLEIFFSEVKI